MKKQALAILMAVTAAASGLATEATVNAASVTGASVSASSDGSTQFLDNAEIILGKKVYNISKGHAVVDDLTVKLGGKVLSPDKDYLTYYKNNDRPGTATVYVVGVDKYKGFTSAEFTVFPDVVSINSLETGKGNILVKWSPVDNADGYQVLYSKDKSFANCHSTTVWASSGKTSVNLSNIPEPGEKYYVKMRAFIVVGGTRFGTYGPVKTKNVLGGIGKITVPTLNYAYRGRDLKPTVTVRDTDGNKLVYDKDYTYTISNCKDVGTATITVKGKGLYTGTGTKKFNVVATEISKASLSGLDTYYSYTGKAVKPEPVLKFNKATLVKGKDYTLSYKNNTQKGTATITVTGKGNFKGSVSKTFKIASEGMVTKNGDTYYYDKKGVMQTGWQEIGGNYYCFDRITGKLVKNTTINKIKVDKNGKAVNLTDYGLKRIKLMMTAHKKVLELTNPSDSMEVKRLKVFKWEVFEHPYWVWRLLANYYKVTDEWDVDFANDIFTRKRGCCVSDSCCCAFMFLEIGYTNIYVCHDGRHGWFTVNDKLYDPLFAENVWSVNYNADYMDYRANPVGRIRID